jgi:hypothetical protein
MMKSAMRVIATLPADCLAGAVQQAADFMRYVKAGPGEWTLLLCRQNQVSPVERKGVRIMIRYSLIYFDCPAGSSDGGLPVHAVNTMEVA